MCNHLKAHNRLHSLMYGLFYPAVLGAIFYEWLAEIFANLPKIFNKWLINIIVDFPGSLSAFYEWLTNIIVNFSGSLSASSDVSVAFLIVIHFAIDFVFTQETPIRTYKWLNFILDLIVLIFLYLAFMSINLSRSEPVNVMGVAVFIACAYIAFIMYALTVKKEAEKRGSRRWWWILVGVECVSVILYGLIWSIEAFVLVDINIGFLIASLVITSILLLYSAKKLLHSTAESNRSAALKKEPV